MTSNFRNMPWIQLGVERGLFRINDVEGTITYLEIGKSYNLTHPEEKTRSKVYLELIDTYKYPPSRIDLEVVGPRREPKLPADIVVYLDDDKEHVFAVVEIKAASSAANIEEAKRQGLGNANLLNAKYLLVVAGTEWIAYSLSVHPPRVSILEKHRLADLPIQYGQEPQYRFLKGDDQNDLKKSSYSELDTKFQLCHEEIWEGGKRDPAIAFDEISKVISSKLSDERFTPHGEPYQFQIGTFETHKDIADRVIALYRDVKKRNPGVFTSEIDLPESILYRLVEHLQDVSLRNTDLDAKGRAFENFLGKIFRGEYGQYFTPRQIVEFMVKAADPTERDRVIDPACGSGGFLLYSMKNVMDAVKLKYHNDKETIDRLSWEFAHNQIFGIEINDRIARVAMMDMVIHDDGQSNIECNDALADYENFNPAKAISKNKYDILLTNPPFGKRIIKQEKEYFPSYYLALGQSGKPKSSQMSEILFIERCIDLVIENGFIGIVLPDSAFTNKKNIPVLEFLLDKTQILGVVSLPAHTFVPYGAQAKTSIVFLRKKARKEKLSDYPIFMAHVEHIGYDATNRQERNDLPHILDEWQLFKSNNFQYPEFKQLRNDLWIAKVNFSQLKNKLDVEAYSKEYIDVIKTIHASTNRSMQVLPLSELCFNLFPGVGPKKADYSDNGIPIIKTATISKITNQFGLIAWENVEYLDEVKYGDSSKCLLENDILIQSVAHSKNYIADKVARVDRTINQGTKVLALSKFVIVRPDPQKINPVYLYVYLSSNLARKQYTHFIRGMSAEIYEFDLRHLLVLVPTEAQQTDIVDSYKKLLKEYQELQRRITNTKNRMDILEGKILSSSYY